MKVARLSALHTGCLRPPWKITGIHFCLRLSRPRGHIVAGKIKSMKNVKDPTGIKAMTFQLVEQCLGLGPETLVCMCFVLRA
jgi:hypothetical protein